MRWTVPNILTVVRLFAALGLIAVYELLPRPLSDWVSISLFVGAALTDYVDGYLARRWGQITAFGRMLDPIADKAMIIIALIILVTLKNGATLIILPAVLIIFREVFVSGLREFLGAKSATLPVTRLAKWKTAAQMVAIAVLFSNGLFEHYFFVQSFAMERETVAAILLGKEEDLMGIAWKYTGYVNSYNYGVGLLWLATGLTWLTGLDYFRKALPFLNEEDSH